MSPLFHASEGIPRLADHLAATRHRSFVGRRTELELFQAALDEERPPFAVLHLFGPGGIGKTTLLREFARLAGATGRFCLSLDGRNIDPSPEGFLLALNQASGQPDSHPSVLHVLAEQECPVLFLDTYEMLMPLDAWLRETFLPQLPQQSLVVIAGRNTPAPAWSADPGWRDLVRVVSLRNLRPEEGQTFLTAWRVPEKHHAEIFAFTHCHPLALSLVVDVFNQVGSDTVFRPEHHPDIIRILLGSFLEHIQSPAHRAALEICAHVRVTTEALLHAVLPDHDAYALFAWLRGLSFIEQGREGLFPHDLAREVLDADLRWRNPDAYQQLHQRIRVFFVQNWQKVQGLAQQRAFFDILYLHRNNPVMKPYYDWDAFGHAYTEPATAGDAPLILEMVRCHEGEASACITRHWLSRQPSAFFALRQQNKELIGFVMNLALHEATAADCEIDPALGPALNFVQRYGPTRPGEQIIYFRNWMARDNYQDATQSPIHSLLAMNSSKIPLTTPKLAWSLIPTANPAGWHAMYSYIRYRPAPEANFSIDGRDYSVYAHDWRAEPWQIWLDALGERELVLDLKPEAMQPVAPLIVLSQPEFVQAVRQALRNYTRPAALASSPLLRSRFLTQRCNSTPTAATLQEAIQEAIEHLNTNPKDKKLRRALWRTYIEPAATQERAAERLNLPFSTYRAHLATGLERITEWLWQRELYGPEN